MAQFLPPIPQFVRSFLGHLARMLTIFVVTGTLTIAAAQEESNSAKKLAQTSDKQKPASDKATTKNKAPAKKPRGTNLISKDFVRNWTWYSAEKGIPLTDVWQVQRDSETGKPILMCKGKPEGYLRTNAEYGDFELSFEWKYPTDKNGNSGVLLYTQQRDRIWPDAVQIQLHGPTTGSIFPTGDAKSVNLLERTELAREVNKWNKCRAISREGKVTLYINGKKVGDVTGCSPSRGRIGLQSEGSEIHFREIYLRKLDPDSKVEESTTAATKASQSTGKPAG